MLVIKLQNPRTEVANLYALSNNRLFEINQLQDGKRSWFAGQSVISNGALSLCTKVDPVFFILPFLMKAKHVSPLDQLLMDEDFPDAVRLEICVAAEQLEKVSDRKTSAAFTAWKYNEAKTLQTLCRRVASIAKHLRQRRVQVTDRAVASNYVKVNEEEVPDSAYTRYAHGLISEYLSKELSAKLEEELGLEPMAKTAAAAVVKDEPREPPAKRQKTVSGPSEPTEDYSKEGGHHTPKEKQKVTAKDKAMASAAKGSRNISSFFAKK